MKRISVPTRRWYENEERDLTFPDRWQVDNLTSPGFDKPGLGSAEIKEKIDHPIEGPSLEELARGKNQAVIVFDDMTRATPAGDVAPHVVESLHRAGMKKDQIRFIWSLGSHGAYDTLNARKKLGDEIIENYAVYNHDPFQNTVRIGRTPTGVELWFNREFMACDLKIGIGGAVAHGQAGFGGGAKIILPGVAGIESIVQLHNQLDRDNTRWGFGVDENNIMVAECDVAGDMAGLNFKVDCLLNRRGEITGLYAGPFRAVKVAGAAEAKEYYGIPYVQGYDIAISNCYGKANEPFVAQATAAQIMKSDGSGTMVIVFDSPEGIVPHYVYRSWGTGYGGRHHIPRVKGESFKRMKKFIIVAPYPDRTMLDIIVHIDDATIVKTWPEARAILEKDYPNSAKVGLVQDATMQYLKNAAAPEGK